MADLAKGARIFDEAQIAARAAVAAAGPEDTASFNCGFAWVTIRPARGDVVAHCKRYGIGDNGWKGGWWIENPGDFKGQQVDQKLAGAQAFAEVLRKHGLTVEVGSRLD